MATGRKKTSKVARIKNALKKASPKKNRSKNNSANESRSTMNAAEVSKAPVISPSRNGDAANMDLDFLRGLIEAVDQSGIDSVEIDRDGTKVKISKTPPAAPLMTAAQMPMPMMQAPTAQHAVAVAAAPAAAAPEVAAPKSNLVDVKSPMVGTFYRSPAPEAPSYVEVGSTVSKGQTLCILEAMKLMNELESDVDGVVREILVDNADPVEYGQVLFRVEPSSR